MIHTYSVSILSIAIYQYYLLTYLHCIGIYEQSIVIQDFYQKLYLFNFFFFVSIVFQDFNLYQWSPIIRNKGIYYQI